MLGEWTQANNVRVTLSSGITNAATSITVTAASAPYNNPANPASDAASNGLGIATLIDVYANPTKTEIITYTTLTNNGNGTYTLSGVTRAREGTTAQAFSAGATLVQTITAAQLKHSKVTYDKTTDTLRAGGNLLVVGQTNTTGGLVVGGGGSVTCDAGFYTSAPSYLGVVNGADGNFTGNVTAGTGLTIAANGANVTGASVFHSAVTFSVQVQFTPIAAPGTPANGWMYYDSSDKRLHTYDGSVWQKYVAFSDLADATHAGVVSTAAQTFAGAKTFLSVSFSTNALGTVIGTATADFSAAATNTLTLTASTACTLSFTAPPANTFVTLKITRPATGFTSTVTFPGTASAGSFGAIPQPTATANAVTQYVFFYDGVNYNLIECSSGALVAAAVGAVPNANGMTISGSTLTLQPADGSNPGVLTAGAQTIGGAKTFTGAMAIANTGLSISMQAGNTSGPVITLFKSRITGGGKTLAGDTLGFINSYGISASPGYYATCGASIGFVQDAAATSASVPTRVEIRTGTNALAASFDRNQDCTITGNIVAKTAPIKTNALGTVGGTATANFSLGGANSCTLTTATPCTFTFTAPSFANCLVALAITQPAAGSATTVTFPASVKPGTLGAIPQPTLTLGAVTEYVFFYDGTNYNLLYCSAPQSANSIGTVTSAGTCDFTKSSFNKVTLTSATACTLSFTAPTGPGYVQVKVTAPPSGTVSTVTWPATVVGTPTAPSTLNKSRLHTFYYDGGNYILQLSSAEY